MNKKMQGLYKPKLIKNRMEKFEDIHNSFPKISGLRVYLTTLQAQVDLTLTESITELEKWIPKGKLLSPIKEGEAEGLRMAVRILKRALADHKTTLINPPTP